MGSRARAAAIIGVVAAGMSVPVVTSPPAAGVSSGVVEYVVTTTADPLDPPAVDGGCTLREAVRSAGLNSTTTTACGQGAWVDGVARLAHITFDGGGRGVVGLEEQLIFPQRPGTEIWLDGEGAPGDPAVVVSGQHKTRILWADSWPEQTVGELNGSLVLRDITLADARTPFVEGSDAGGAVRSGLQMKLDVDRVTFAGNEAAGGSALYLLGTSNIRNSTFANNHSRTNEFRTGAVTVVNRKTTIFGSTFLHNTNQESGPGYGRDLVVRTGAFHESAFLELGYNVFVAPQNDTGPSCELEGTEMRSVGGRPNLHSTGSDFGRCFTAMGGMGGARHALLVPVPDDDGAALADHGGWAPSVLLTAASESHDLPGVEGFPPDYCEKFLATPTLPGIDARATDVRGVPRPTGHCDAGAIQRAPQTIDFPQPAEGSTYVGASLPEPQASSGGPVTLDASLPEICDILGGTLQLLALGECTVTATQPGTDLFRAAPPVQRTFQVTRTPRTVAFSDAPDSAHVGGTWQLAATASDGTAPDYRTTTPDVCSLEAGAVSFDALGACTLWAELPETDTTSAASDHVTIQVLPVPPPTPQTITWSPAAPTNVRVGQTLQVTATGGGSTNAVVVQGPPAPRKGKPVCTITRTVPGAPSTTVTVRLDAVGTCALTATQQGNADYSAAESALQFAVLKKTGGRK